MNGEKKGTKEIPISIRYICSPLYECSVETINKKEGFDIINAVLAEVKKTIEEKGGNFLLESNPTVLGENKKKFEQLKKKKNKKMVFDLKMPK